MTKMIRFSTLAVVLIVVFGIFYTSCNKILGHAAASMELVSGDNQTATVETALTNPVVVIVKDKNDNAVKGITVNFTVTEGSVSVATDTTDAEGKATVNWTLGATEGTQTLTVTAFKADGTTALTGSPISVTATGSAITVTDIDGNVYQTTKIGDQLWMAEDLKVSHYPNGDAIPYIDDDATWGALADDNTSDAYCFYGDSNDDGTVDIAYPDYGAIYSYAAAIGDDWLRDNTETQGVCPDGWHLPSDAEWTELIDNLGGESVAGGKLKETGTSHWMAPNTETTNESGFSALPGSGRDCNNGEFELIGAVAIWWSATPTYADSTSVRLLENNSPSSGHTNSAKSNGLSVRCVKN